MARTKVDDKLNVVIGTKAQVEADNTIPENSIIITTDEELTPSDIPDLDAGKITTGTFGVDRIPSLAPSKITQDANNRFVTDTEKSTWNGKQEALGFTPENQVNKKTTLTNSDVDFPTTKAVKTAIDTAISQTLKPMGNWNASTNSPTLTNSDTSKANQVWYVNVAGTQFGIEFDVGDELVYNTNGVIFKRDNVDAVISVNGKEGVVVLTQDDIADGTTYKRVTDTEKSTWNGKQNALTAGDGISISGNVISADSGLTVDSWNTATKTLALSDANKLFVCSNENNQTLTIPTHASVPFSTGTMITFLLINPYTLTFIGASGVVIWSMDSLVELATQYGMASLIKLDASTWQLVGALE